MFVFPLESCYNTQCQIFKQNKPPKLFIILHFPNSQIFNIMKTQLNCVYLQVLFWHWFIKQETEKVIENSSKTKCIIELSAKLPGIFSNLWEREKNNVVDRVLITSIKLLLFLLPNHTIWVQCIKGGVDTQDPHYQSILHPRCFLPSYI